MDLTVTDDTVLEDHNEDPKLVQMRLIGDGVVESIMKGEDIGITHRRSRSSATQGQNHNNKYKGCVGESDRARAASREPPSVPGKASRRLCAPCRTRPRFERSSPPPFAAPATAASRLDVRPAPETIAPEDDPVRGTRGQSASNFGAKNVENGAPVNGRKPRARKLNAAATAAASNADGNQTQLETSGSAPAKGNFIQMK
ncbi:unnamed protein product [Brassicogethes aeneus]|uniref:Lysine-specific demethylase 3A/B tudor domain-containing protein n=1 Tax=Brassicogethes aeneus TaxID=1431903 RepID=A0A9P0B0L2_BRAAE|nr:unnamed protein product [Brassicogethes aeneus]